jgi:hypothetical protein
MTAAADAAVVAHAMHAPRPQFSLLKAEGGKLLTPAEVETMVPLVVSPPVVTAPVGQDASVVQALHAVTAALQVLTTRGGHGGHVGRGGGRGRGRENAIATPVGKTMVPLPPVETAPVGQDAHVVQALHVVTAALQVLTTRGGRSGNVGRGGGRGRGRGNAISTPAAAAVGNCGRGRGRGRGSGRGGTSGAVLCWNCGGVGHMAIVCPSEPGIMGKFQMMDAENEAHEEDDQSEGNV